MPKLIAEIDSDLIELVPGFLSSKRKDVLFILSSVSIDCADFEAVRRIGHQLRGDGAGYGFEPISAYGAAIERAAGERDLDAICRYSQELSDYLDSVEVVAANGVPCPTDVGRGLVEPVADRFQATRVPIVFPAARPEAKRSPEISQFAGSQASGSWIHRRPMK